MIRILRNYRLLQVLAIAAVALLTISSSASAQKFDYKRLDAKMRQYTVIIEMNIEISFGMQSSEEEEQFLGTIVTDDGMVIFNGAAVSSDNMFSSMAGMTVKTTPSNIRVKTLDGHSYAGEYLGADRYTHIGFIKIQSTDNDKFTPINFVDSKTISVGNWVTLFRLLPDFITPPLAADIGMVSNIVESPEHFPLTVGFIPDQITSVVFDENLAPVGVLGTLIDPSAASPDASGMLDSFDGSQMPVLGIITGERLKKLLTAPPSKGTPDRAWLGITLQGLTKELAEYWGLDVKGGIIVSDVVKGSPAATAGLKTGDIIYAVNGEPVTVDREENISIFQRKISEMGPGTAVKFSVIRHEGETPEKVTLAGTLEKAPLSATDAEEFEDNNLEFTARDLVFSDFLQRGLEQNEISGVVVSKLERGGLASVAGLQLGDIIQRIGSTKISSVDDVRAVSEEIQTDNPREVIFFVWRNGSTLFVNVKPK